MALCGPTASLFPTKFDAPKAAQPGTTHLNEQAEVVGSPRILLSSNEKTRTVDCIAAGLRGVGRAAGSRPNSAGNHAQGRCKAGQRLRNGNRCSWRSGWRSQEGAFLPEGRGPRADDFRIRQRISAAAVNRAGHRYQLEHAPRPAPGAGVGEAVRTDDLASR